MLIRQETFVILMVFGWCATASFAGLSVDVDCALYHLDASRRETLETDSQGCVTAWRSANGNGYCFRSEGPAPVLAKLGDQDAVAFSGKPGERLVGSASVEQ